MSAPIEVICWRGQDRAYCRINGGPVVTFTEALDWIAWHMPHRLTWTWATDQPDYVRWPQ